MSNGKYRPESRRLQHWDYTTPGGYFVTICTHLRKPIFGRIKNGEMYLSYLGKIVNQEWVKTAILRDSVELDEYVIMPNHLHGIIIIKSAEERSGLKVRKKSGYRLGTIVGQFKSACTRRIQAVFDVEIVWQSRYYDHVIRDDNDLQRIRGYIQGNPKKWELDKYYCG